MSGQALRESFVNHVLLTAGLDEDVVQKIIEEGRINSIHKLKLLTPADLTYLADNLDLALGDVLTLKAIQTWLVNYKRGETPGGNTLPSTLEGWLEKFTEESFIRYTSPPEQQESSAPYTTPVKASSAPLNNINPQIDPSSATVTNEDKRKNKLSVKLSDYPRFSGKTREWYLLY